MRMRLGLCAVLIALLQCRNPDNQQADGSAYILIEEAAITLPRKPQWIKETLPAETKDVVLRLTRDLPVSGSPRIEVIAEIPSSNPPSLKHFVARSLASLRRLAQNRTISFIYEDKRRERLGKLRTMRLRNDYLLAAGSQDEVSISQVSYLFINAGKEITVSAVGRTELFAPLADSIEEILHGIRPLTTLTAHAEQDHDLYQQTRSPLLRYRTYPPPDAISGASFFPGYHITQ